MTNPHAWNSLQAEAFVRPDIEEMLDVLPDDDPADAAHSLMEAFTARLFLVALIPLAIAMAAVAYGIAAWFSLTRPGIVASVAVAVIAIAALAWGVAP